MLKKSAQHLLRAQISFLLFLIPCIIIWPRIFWEDLGISNYGVNRFTIIPFSIGYLLCAFFIEQAAKALPRTSSKHHLLRGGLLLISGLLVALLLVPDSQIDWIRYLHIAIAMTTFAAELIVGLWLVVGFRAQWPDILLFLLQALAALSAFLSLGHILPFEASSQIVFQVAFLSLSIRAANRLS